jgi:peroxiredoxin
MALTESTMIELGAIAPEFALPDVVTGRTVRRADFQGKKALLVMFVCAHCPYVKHLNEGLAALGKGYADQPLGIVAIGSNDAISHPADGPEGLKQQAETFGFHFPYLYDETQEVAHAYQAVCTPDFFLFDGEFRLVYRGQFDSSRPRTEIPVTGEDLRAAIDQVLAGNPVPTEQRASVGCSIKWRP